MDKIEQVKQLLKKLGLPERQQSDICALTILGLSEIRHEDCWSSATNKWHRVHDIIAFAKEKYSIIYAENSRETFRKQALHHFRTAALVEDNGKATNSPNYCWRLTAEFLDVLRNIELNDKPLKKFLKNHKQLVDTYASKKKMQKMPVKINGHDFTFSTGKHNQLQKAIIEEFAPRFAPNAECLYVGDTIKKDLVKHEERLKELGFKITIHDKMPDVVLYRPDKNWLYFVEAVTSVGPMDPKRIQEITAMTADVTADRIFVTAFLDFQTYKKFSADIAWETEIWIAYFPDHMIHMNGNKFLGPRIID